MTINLYKSGWYMTSDTAQSDSLDMVIAEHGNVDHNNPASLGSAKACSTPDEAEQWLDIMSRYDDMAYDAVMEGEAIEVAA